MPLLPFQVNLRFNAKRDEGMNSSGSSSSASSSVSDRSRHPSTSSYSQTTNGSSSPSDEETILSSIIYCIHYKNGCTWSDELKNLKDHLKVCSFDAVECPSQCSATVPRLSLDEHLRFECALRPIPCQYCNKICVSKDLKVHQRSCNTKASNIYVNANEFRPTPALRKKVPRFIPEPNVNANSNTAECNKRYVECSGCHRQIMSTLLQNHQIHCEGSTSNSLSAAFQQQKNHSLSSYQPEISSEAKENDYCNVFEANSCEFNEIGCNFKGQRNERNLLESHLNDNENEHVSLISSVTTKQQQQISHLRKSLSKLTLNHTGTLVWRIRNFSAKLKEAEAKEGVELISSAFYTGQYGFKIQASVFLNGNGVGEGSHISVYIKILPGEYDAMVKWPFAHPVSFTLFDQNPVVEKILNIEESFNPDPNWINFQRPSREPDVLGFGFPRFVSHETLKKRHYVEGDTIFLRIKVDTARRISS